MRKTRAKSKSREILQPTKDNDVGFRMTILVGSSIPERLASLERVCDALLGLAFTAQADECLAFEVEQILLGHRLRSGD
jgi:hypothetical protein